MRRLLKTENGKVEVVEYYGLRKGSRSTAQRIAGETEMKFEIDDKDIAKEIAEKAQSYMYDCLSREDYRNLWYNREIADALNLGISQI